MIRQMMIACAAGALLGCQPISKTTDSSGSRGSAPSDYPQQFTMPGDGATANARSSDDPWMQGVKQVVTKPVVISRPTTQSTASRVGSGNTAPLANDVPQPVLKLDTVKRVDTSLSTAPLLRLLAMKLNNIPYDGFAGYGVVDFVPRLPEGTNPDAMTNDVLSREPAGTSTAIERLIKGEIDMAFVSRLPSPEERAAAAQAKVTLRHDLLATEALVFTVNAANPITNITTDALKRFFARDAKTWADLKLVDFPLTNEIAAKPITVAYRAKGLATEELLQQLLLSGKAVPELPLSEALSGAKLVLDATNEDPQTLGFANFCYATNMDRDGRTKVLAVEGVMPEPSRVAAGEYPLTTPVYLLTRTNLDPKSELVNLRKWLLSMSGQKVLAEAGYMPMVAEAWTQQRLMNAK